MASTKPGAVQYLKFADQVKKLNKRFDLSYHEIELLDMVAKAHLSGRTIFVGDFVYQNRIASQSTLHGVFKGLTEKKLLSTKPHEEDGRIKKVCLTKLALDHYKRLHVEMNKAVAK